MYIYILYILFIGLAIQLQFNWILNGNKGILKGNKRDRRGILTLTYIWLVVTGTSVIFPFSWE